MRIVAFVVKGHFFPGDTFTRSYPGNPPWHHLTVPFVLDRLQFYLYERSYITLPFLVCVIWGLVVRNPLIPLGYLACLPWLLLHIAALHPTPGTLELLLRVPIPAQPRLAPCRAPHLGGERPGEPSSAGLMCWSCWSPLLAFNTAM